MLLNPQNFPLFNGSLMRHRNVNLPSPPSRRNRQELRNAQIKADFKAQHKRGFRNEVIYQELADKYFLAPDTIERIVFQRGAYKVAVSTATVPASSAGAQA